MFGLLPDTISWMPWFFVNLFQGKFGEPNLSMLPDWIWTMYGVGHSLVLALLIIALFFGISYYKKKELPYFMLAWPLAILMDIVTHSREFLPTPFLWPISAWKFPGFSWGQWWFMILNYSLIAVCIIGIIVWKKLNIKRNKGKKRVKNDK